MLKFTQNQTITQPAANTQIIHKYTDKEMSLISFIRTKLNNNYHFLPEKNG